MENQGFSINHIPVQGGHESSRPEYADINSNVATLAQAMQNMGTHESSPRDQFQVNNPRDTFAERMTSYSLEKPEAHGSPYNNGNLPDPMMRQAYAYAMPPAGLPLRQEMERSSPNRKYNMASDIFGTGMDKSWTAGSPPNGPRDFPTPTRALQTSFKITESPNTGGGYYGDAMSDPSQNPTAGRRARESLGNPLTGQGYNDSSSKTAKRYFDGSNANQKLW